MARLPNSLLRKAHAIDDFLPALLGQCRDLRTAQNELRWLREHVDGVAKARLAKGDTLAKDALLRELVRQRARGKPLQYLLGTEFFGDLSIRCREGVLIPRQDTAASISHLVRLIRDAQNLPEELRVLDLCTGTGCIPLLFRHEFYEARRDIVVRALGVDVADRALKLASHNLRRMRRLISWVDQGDVDFMKADILTNPFHDMGEGPLSFKIAINRQRRLPFWDILISNPPYISPSEYWKTTTRSVRGFEPKLALVPPSSSPNETDTQLGDRFYGPLLTIAHDVEAKIMLLEVADLDQALRVAHKVRDFTNFVGVEIWRDQPSAEEDTAPTSIDGIPIVGQGNVRSVICWRGLGTQWLGKSSKEPTYEDHNLTLADEIDRYFNTTIFPKSSETLHVPVFHMKRSPSKRHHPRPVGRERKSKQNVEV